MNDLEMPEGLSEQGHRAHAVIMRVLTEGESTHTGGCKAFYSPQEWAARGEEYGTHSHLVVVYDGGAHRKHFTLDEECYELTEEMQAALREAGLHFEECTTWYGAVYGS